MKNRILQALVIILLAAAQAGFAQSGVTHYIRYSHEGKTSLGILENDIIHELWGDDLFVNPPRTGNTVPLDQVRVEIPVESRQIFALGLNYQDHLGDRDIPEVPSLFVKLPSTLAAHEEPIVYRDGFSDLHYEAELVLIIGRTGKDIPLDEAGDYIFGVTAGNDISERVWQASHRHLVRAKGSDQFGPVGPVIATGLDYNNLNIESRLNGELRQSSNTRYLMRGAHELVSHISQYVTLLPGDMIFTGTPGQTAAMQPGDTVEISLQGVGVLRNRIVADKR